MTNKPDTPDGEAVAWRWHLASMNDGLFIINAPPRPSTDDIFPDRSDGPSIVLNVTELPEAKAIKIVAVMNLLASPPPASAGVREAIIEECAKIADTFICGVCGMDGKAGAAIRALSSGEKSK